MHGPSPCYNNNSDFARYPDSSSFKQMNEVPAPGPGLHHHHAARGGLTGPLMDYNNVNVQDLC